MFRGKCVLVGAWVVSLGGLAGADWRDDPQFRNVAENVAGLEAARELCLAAPALAGGGSQGARQLRLGDDITAQLAAAGQPVSLSGQPAIPPAWAEIPDAPPSGANAGWQEAARARQTSAERLALAMLDLPELAVPGAIALLRMKAISSEQAFERLLAGFRSYGDSNHGQLALSKWEVGYPATGHGGVLLARLAALHNRGADLEAIWLKMDLDALPPRDPIRRLRTLWKLYSVPLEDFASAAEDAFATDFLPLDYMIDVIAARQIPAEHQLQILRSQLEGKRMMATSFYVAAVRTADSSDEPALRTLLWECSESFPVRGFDLGSVLAELATDSAREGCEFPHLLADLIAFEIDEQRAASRPDLSALAAAAQLFASQASPAELTERGANLPRDLLDLVRGVNLATAYNIRADEADAFLRLGRRVLTGADLGLLVHHLIAEIAHPLDWIGALAVAGETEGAINALASSPSDRFTSIRTTLPTKTLLDAAEHLLLQSDSAKGLYGAFALLRASGSHQTDHARLTEDEAKRKLLLLSCFTSAWADLAYVAPSLEDEIASLLLARLEGGIPLDDMRRILERLTVRRQLGEVLAPDGSVPSGVQELSVKAWSNLMPLKADPSREIEYLINAAEHAINSGNADEAEKFWNAVKRILSSPASAGPVALEAWRLRSIAARPGDLKNEWLETMARLERFGTPRRHLSHAIANILHLNFHTFGTGDALLGGIELAAALTDLNEQMSFLNSVWPEFAPGMVNVSNLREFASPEAAASRLEARLSDFSLEARTFWASLLLSSLWWDRDVEDGRERWLRQLLEAADQSWLREIAEAAAGMQLPPSGAAVLYAERVEGVDLRALPLAMQAIMLDSYTVVKVADASPERGEPLIRWMVEIWTEIMDRWSEPWAAKTASRFPADGLIELTKRHPAVTEEAGEKLAESFAGVREQLSKQGGGRPSWQTPLEACISILTPTVPNTLGVVDKIVVLLAAGDADGAAALLAKLGDTSQLALKTNVPVHFSAELLHTANAAAANLRSSHPGESLYLRFLIEALDWTFAPIPGDPKPIRQMDLLKDFAATEIHHAHLAELCLSAACGMDGSAEIIQAKLEAWRGALGNAEFDSQLHGAARQKRLLTFTHTPLRRWLEALALTGDGEALDEVLSVLGPPLRPGGFSIWHALSDGTRTALRDSSLSSEGRRDAEALALTLIDMIPLSPLNPETNINELYFVPELAGALLGSMSAADDARLDESVNALLEGIILQYCPLSATSPIPAYGMKHRHPIDAAIESAGAALNGEAAEARAAAFERLMVRKAGFDVGWLSSAGLSHSTAVEAGLLADADALRRLQEHRSREPDNLWLAVDLARVHLSGGDGGAARRIMEDMPERLLGTAHPHIGAGASVVLQYFRLRLPRVTAER